MIFAKPQAIETLNKGVQEGLARPAAKLGAFLSISNSVSMLMRVNQCAIHVMPLGVHAVQ